MIDEPNTTEDAHTAMDASNFAIAEKRVVASGRKAIKDYDHQLDRFDKVVGQIHQTILAFGRVLAEGKAMYPSPKEFGWWVERRNLNTGRLASHPAERSACQKIAELHDSGPEEGTGSRLDLSDCKLTTPTNILKWARANQRHLFPHMPPKAAVMHPKPKPAIDDGRLATACGYCGKTAAQVGELLLTVHGPSSAICDGCIAIGVKLVAERKQPQGKARTFAEALRADEDAPLDDIYPTDGRQG